MNQPVLYNNAKQALTEYHRVDEVKDFRDKAKAMEEYAKEAQDHSLQRLAAQARLRAERRWGELYKESEKAQGKRNDLENNLVPEKNEVKTLDEMGVSRKQSSNWQKLSDIPEEEFEAYLEDEQAIPSSNKIINDRKPEPINPVDQDSIQLWGSLRDLSDLIEKRSLSSIMSSMPDHLVEETEQNLNLLRRWTNA